MYHTSFALLTMFYCKDRKKVRHLFKHVQPHGLTPIGNKLDVLVGDYLDKLERAARRKRNGDSHAFKHVKPVNFIVITDGAPSKPLVCIRMTDNANFTFQPTNPWIPLLRWHAGWTAGISLLRR